MKTRKKEDQFSKQPAELTKYTANYLNHGDAQRLSAVSKHFLFALDKKYFHHRKDEEAYFLTTYSQLFDAAAKALKNYLENVNPPTSVTIYDNEYDYVYNKASNRARWFLSIFLNDAILFKFRILAMHALKKGAGKRLNHLVSGEIKSAFKNSLAPNLEHYLIEKCFYSTGKIQWMIDALLRRIDQKTLLGEYTYGSTDIIKIDNNKFNHHLLSQELEADKHVINKNAPNHFAGLPDELTKNIADYLNYGDIQSLATTSKHFLFALRSNHYLDQKQQIKIDYLHHNLNQMRLAVMKALKTYLCEVTPPEQRFILSEGHDAYYKYYKYDKASNRAAWFLSILTKDFPLIFQVISMYTLLHRGKGERLGLLLKQEIESAFINKMIPNVEKWLTKHTLSGEKINATQDILLQCIDGQYLYRELNPIISTKKPFEFEDAYINEKLNDNYFIDKIVSEIIASLDHFAIRQKRQNENCHVM